MGDLSVTYVLAVHRCRVKVKYGNGREEVKPDAHLQHVDVDFLPAGDEVADGRVLHLIPHQNVGVLREGT